MTPDPTSPPISPVVRWLAVALAVCTFCPLLALGGLTSSARAGMADPVWPTPPWYVIVNGQEFRDGTGGFQLEHSHRFVGYIVGGLAAAAAVGAWLAGPDKRKRVLPLIAVFAVLGFYGWFQGAMTAEGRRWGEAKAAGLPFTVAWPWPSIAATLLAVAGLLLAAVRQLFQPDRARWVRFLATAVLLGVMTQGLIGGLRVFLDVQAGLRETVGVELSQLHGLFAQVVFTGMVLLALLAGRPKAELSDADRRRVRWPALAVPAAVFVQLIWAVWIRHGSSVSILAVSQRLHLITAFVVAGLIVWLVTRVSLTPTARKPLGFGAHLLAGLLLVQVLLGVEAWMGKFSATGPEGHLPPTARTDIYSHLGPVLLRTAHQLIGAGLLATGAAVAFRALRPAAVSGEPGPQGPRVPTAVVEPDPIASSV